MIKQRARRMLVEHQVIERVIQEVKLGYVDLCWKARVLCMRELPPDCPLGCASQEAVVQGRSSRSGVGPGSRVQLISENIGGAEWDAED